MCTVLLYVFAVLCDLLFCALLSFVGAFNLSLFYLATASPKSLMLSKIRSLVFALTSANLKPFCWTKFFVFYDRMKITSELTLRSESLLFPRRRTLMFLSQ